MTRIIYDKRNGLCIGRVNDDRDIMNSFINHSEEFRENLAEIYVENVPERLQDYKIENEKLLPLSNREIRELRDYNKILTDEERQLQKLKPSPEEVKKAENTIEILTLIQEVI